MLGEEISLGFFPECRLNDAGAGSADRLGVGERKRPGMTGRILFDRDGTRHAFACHKLAAHHRAESLGRDHDHIDVVRRNDRAIMNCETVGEEQRLTRSELGRDLRFGRSRPFSYPAEQERQRRRGERPQTLSLGEVRLGGQ